MDVKVLIGTNIPAMEALRVWEETRGMPPVILAEPLGLRGGIYVFEGRTFFISHGPGWILVHEVPVPKKEDEEE